MTNGKGREGTVRDRYQLKHSNAQQQWPPDGALHPAQRPLASFIPRRRRQLECRHSGEIRYRLIGGCLPPFVHAAMIRVARSRDFALYEHEVLSQRDLLRYALPRSRCARLAERSTGDRKWLRFCGLPLLLEFLSPNCPALGHGCQRSGQNWHLTIFTDLRRSAVTRYLTMSFARSG
jgi:hypothetical protein